MITRLITDTEIFREIQSYRFVGGVKTTASTFFNLHPVIHLIYIPKYHQALLKWVFITISCCFIHES